MQTYIPHSYSPNALLCNHVPDNQETLPGSCQSPSTYFSLRKNFQFVGNFLLAPPKEGGCSQNPSIPWVRKEPDCHKAEHTHVCFISLANWQYLFSSYCRVGPGECQIQICKIPSLPLRSHCSFFVLVLFCFVLFISKERIRYTNKKY